MIRLLDAPAIAAWPCSAVSARIYELLDGELPPDECAAMRRHLEDCAGCRASWLRERRFLDVVRRRTRLEPASPWFRRRLLATLEHEAGPRRPS